MCVAVCVADVGDGSVVLVVAVVCLLFGALLMPIGSTAVADGSVVVVVPLERDLGATIC